MSGIVAVLDLRGDQVDGDRVRDLVQSLAFRGPDGQRTWTDGPVGLGFTLFRTHDGASLQPSAMDPDLHIVADLRLDDRERLIAELRDRGILDFAIVPDSELVLRAYRVWGDACVKHLMGDFAFVIWDGARRRMLCARSPLGARLLYYARVGDQLVVSNTLACIRRHPAVSDRLNDMAIADFLLFGHNTDQSTTSFADIQRLPPAHVLTTECGIGRMSVEKYWTWPEPAPIRYRKEAEYVEHFLDLWFRVVADRVRTDRVALTLSGGMDSTSIAAALRELMDRDEGRGLDVRAFSVYLERLIPDDEPHYTRLVSEKLGIPVEFISVDDEVFFKGFDEEDPSRRVVTPEPVDQPGVWWFRAYLERLAGQGRVLLDGEDGDSLFYLPSLPVQLDYLGIGEVLGTWGRFVATRRKLPSTGLRVRERVGIRPRPVHYTFPDWIAPDLVEPLGLRGRWEAFWQDPPRDSSRPEMKDRLLSAMWQRMFEMYDPGVSGVLIELRQPFIDLRLIEFVMAIPPLPWCYRKELLRTAMRGRLPDAVLRRPKTYPPGLNNRRLEQLQRDPPARGPIALETSRYVTADSVSLPTHPGPLGTTMMATRPFILNYWLRNSR